MTIKQVIDHHNASGTSQIFTFSGHDMKHIGFYTSAAFKHWCKDKPKDIVEMAHFTPQQEGNRFYIVMDYPAIFATEIIRIASEWSAIKAEYIRKHEEKYKKAPVASNKPDSGPIVPKTTQPAEKGSRPRKRIPASSVRVYSTR